MFWHAPPFVLFSVAYKHINGIGEIALYLAQTGLPLYVTNMHVCFFERIWFMHGYWKKQKQNKMNTNE